MLALFIQILATRVAPFQMLETVPGKEGGKVTFSWYEQFQQGGRSTAAMLPYRWVGTYSSPSEDDNQQRQIHQGFSH